MNPVLRYLINRASERSTVAGLVTAVAAVVPSISPEVAEAINPVVVAIAGLVLALVPTGGGKRSRIP